MEKIRSNRWFLKWKVQINLITINQGSTYTHTHTHTNTHKYAIQVCSWSIYIYIIGQVGTVFRQWSCRPVFNPRSVIPKTLKMVLDTSLLNTQQYKVCIKSKVEQSRERSSALPCPTLRCSSYWKGSLLVALDYGRQLFTYICLLMLVHQHTCTLPMTNACICVVKCNFGTHKTRLVNSRWKTKVTINSLQG